jgi:mannose-6-phosphate isomerase-like protein (cupin superfamily)
MAKVKKPNKTPKYQLGHVNPVEAPNFTMNAAELFEYLPPETDFIIKRIYWLTKVKGEKKSGQHAHSDEDELFVVMQGSATIVLDDGGGLKPIKLSENDTVWIPKFIWHGFSKLSEDCIVLALTSTNYDPERKGYINDPAEFAKLSSK